MSPIFDLAVLGAGASGLFCALTAARRGRSVLLLDHLARPARKLRLSGGGRCNFTNMQLSAADYVGGNPHFPKSALARFGPWDAVALVEEFGLPWEEREQGRCFLRCGADRLADGLLGAARAAGVVFVFGAPVTAVEPGGPFVVRAGGEAHRAHRVVLALGGPSWKGSGGTRAAFDLARGLGLPVVSPRAALAPLAWAGEGGLEPVGLTGLSVRVALSWPDGASGGAIPAGSVTDELLFTHQGISGPAVLRASLRLAPGAALAADFLPGEEVAAVLAEASTKALVRNALCARFPARLAAALAGEAGETRVADLGKAALAKLAARLKNLPVMPAAAPGFERAEVTAGGVDTAALSSKDLSARALPGFYCIGEAVDVTGDLGGYNLHWAWASGHAAGSAA
ncbi:HI0933 family protein [Desulfovibrio sp. X2]|uniref:NAD(P)/FAD-dependent oxidoreductase n=1 Tax=Desulfovibrio sp. X2 TaxID=941449 RepID=UPI000358D788|nr:aminoacetone oxidase family FAD-binding enzyme [Desulfovibrio sp. X2]EPR42760.1 HI0933 family protein [Desulfovibrio sp. X2]